MSINSDKTSVLPDHIKYSLPDYIKVIHGDLYKSPLRCKIADSMIVCMLKKFFLYDLLVDELNKEIASKRRIMQFGIPFGNQILQTSLTAGGLSTYCIIDINPTEVKRLQKKCKKNYNHLVIYDQDARYITHEKKYDYVICFFLLSDVPNESRKKIIKNALSILSPSGKAIFIDWSTPIKFHPFGYFLKIYNRLHHPFVEQFLKKDISDYVDKNFANRFSWKKTSYFGNMFKKTVARNKNNSENLLAYF